MCLIIGGIIRGDAEGFYIVFIRAACLLAIGAIGGLVTRCLAFHWEYPRARLRRCGIGLGWSFAFVLGGSGYLLSWMGFENEAGMDGVIGLSEL